MDASASIFHLAVESAFRAGLGPDDYAPADLAEVGFVHCADEGAVLPVADDYFSGATEPVLLVEIDPQRLVSELRYEDPAPIAGGGNAHLKSASKFPHVYGPIQRVAIARLGALGRGETGYAWPSSLVERAAGRARSGRDGLRVAIESRRARRVPLPRPSCRADASMTG